ncbi:hypothetical protein HU200_028503 [Digitaria exilis]|uniref:Uncharacterized protein n=1 Tax=Digitaria exilis TaxID=1010633 RepID=A0A835BVF6_9POAL|nr:hypothetical protein HU200_028503 [Digitaria exilis]
MPGANPRAHTGRLLPLVDKLDPLVLETRRSELFPIAPTPHNAESKQASPARPAQQSGSSLPPMATIATMTMLKPAAAKIVAQRSAPPSTTTGGVSLRKKSGLSLSMSASSPAAAAMAGAFFHALASSDAALAAQQVADVAAEAGSDNRGQLLLFVVAPAIGWVLYNILQPALNQLNRMRSQAVVAGLGGLGAAAAMASAPEAEAAAVQNLAALAEAAAAAPADDNRGLLLLIVVAPAIGWVLFNILQPALNQLNRMRAMGECTCYGALQQTCYAPMEYSYAMTKAKKAAKVKALACPARGSRRRTLLLRSLDLTIGSHAD